MKWNTQQKAVVAVLALAGAAFCVDRFVLGYGPRSASAVPPSETTADLLASAPAADSATAAAKAMIRTVSLADRIARLASSAETPSATDAFATPASWVKLLPTDDKPVDSAAIAPVTTANGDSFTLSSVIAGPHVATPAARINGRLITVGQKINGHELLRVEREPGKNFVAILRGRGSESEIRVPLVIGGDNAPPPGPDASEGSPSGVRN